MYFRYFEIHSVIYVVNGENEFSTRQCCIIANTLEGRVGITFGKDLISNDTSLVWRRKKKKNTGKRVPWRSLVVRKRRDPGSPASNTFCKCRFSNSNRRLCRSPIRVRVRQRRKTMIDARYSRLVGREIRSHGSIIFPTMYVEEKVPFGIDIIAPHCTCILGFYGSIVMVCVVKAIR